MPWTYLQVLAPGETGPEFAPIKPLVLTDDDIAAYQRGEALR